MLRSRLARGSAAVVAALVLSSCYGPLNTWVGLTTPQSTISGSNYAFAVEPDSRKVVPAVSFNPGEAIRSGDTFAVWLDAGFLRYLQGVDPYVVVYSEAWVGGTLNVVDSKEKLRQVVLLKDGISSNARLPLSKVPLLGPVKLEKDDGVVFVTIKVVSLSSRDNKESVALINAVAQSVGTVQPQYVMAAGAAGALGEAIVSLNRDKIEFEHSFTFRPAKAETASEQADRASREAASAANSRGAHESDYTLRNGQFVVFKGENESRVVPYPNWYYYILPLNWFGHTPDNVSRRYAGERALPGLGDSIDTQAPNALFTIVRAPFFLVGALFVPYTWGGKSSSEVTDPTSLYVDGDHLIAEPGGRFNPYGEKTHMVVSVDKMDVEAKNFTDTMRGFSAHTALLERELGKPVDSAALFAKAIDQIAGAIVAERAASGLMRQASLGTIDAALTSDKALTDAGITDPTQRAHVREQYIERATEQTRDHFIGRAQEMHRRIIRLTAESKAKSESAATETDEAKKKELTGAATALTAQATASRTAFFSELQKLVNANIWQFLTPAGAATPAVPANVTVKSNTDHPEKWGAAWNKVIDSLDRFVLSLRNADDTSIDLAAYGLGATGDHLDRFYITPVPTPIPQPTPTPVPASAPTGKGTATVLPSTTPETISVEAATPSPEVTPTPAP